MSCRDLELILVLTAIARRACAVPGGGGHRHVACFGVGECDVDGFGRAVGLIGIEQNLPPRRFRSRAVAEAHRHDVGTVVDGPADGFGGRHLRAGIAPAGCSVAEIGGHVEKGGVGGDRPVRSGERRNDDACGHRAVTGRDVVASTGIGHAANVCFLEPWLVAVDAGIDDGDDHTFAGGCLRLR